MPRAKGRKSTLDPLGLRTATPSTIYLPKAVREARDNNNSPNVKRGQVKSQPLVPLAFRGKDLPPDEFETMAVSAPGETLVEAAQRRRVQQAGDGDVVFQAIAVWGLDDSGAFGRNVLSFFPEKRVTELALGNEHVLALTAEGELFVRGSNSHGQLGVGRGPPNMANFHQVRAVWWRVALVCFLRSVFGCFFVLFFLCFALSVRVDVATPLFSRSSLHPSCAQLRSGVQSIAAYALQSACIDADGGRLWHWGSFRPGSDHQLASCGVAWQPQRVGAAELRGARVVRVALGQEHAMLLTDKRDLYSWGYNSVGQLGAWKSFVCVFCLVHLASLSLVFTARFAGLEMPPTDAASEVVFPIPQRVIGDVRLFAVGAWHNVAVLDNPLVPDSDQVLLWGSNLGGVLCVVAGAVAAPASPRRDVNSQRLSLHPAPERISSLLGSSANDHTLTAAADSDALCVPTPTPVNVDQPFAGPRRVRLVAAGGHHTLAQLVDGTVLGWGLIDVLGTGRAGFVTPQPIATAEHFVHGRQLAQLVAAGDMSVFVTAEGRAFAAGDNRYQRLALSERVEVALNWTPIQLENDVSIAHVALGDSRSAIVTQWRHKRPIRDLALPELTAQDQARRPVQITALLRELAANTKEDLFRRESPDREVEDFLNKVCVCALVRLCVSHTRRYFCAGSHVQLVRVVRLRIRRGGERGCALL